MNYVTFGHDICHGFFLEGKNGCTRRSFIYNTRMQIILDKAIIFVCCLTALIYTSLQTELTVALLTALLTSALRETSLFTKQIRAALPLAYLVLPAISQMFFFFVPLIAYDCFRLKPMALKVSWIVSFCIVWYSVSFELMVVVGLLSIIACALSWRTNTLEYEREEYRKMRDDSRELSLVLEQKQQELQERQDYEVRLATLDERGRIAREIHDNVGHLLTRSVLQIEALQVVHANDAQVKEGLEQVGATIHEAFNTVRESVHELHDDAFDLKTQLHALAYSTQGLKVKLEFESEAIPPSVGHCFLAIVKESLTNTVKHSNATKVRVSVAEYPAFWQLIIHDNGNKNPFWKKESLFSSTESLAVGEGGIGLKTMDERTRVLGGVFRVDYAAGFRVFVSIPKEKTRVGHTSG